MCRRVSERLTLGALALVMLSACQSPAPAPTVPPATLAPAPTTAPTRPAPSPQAAPSALPNASPQAAAVTPPATGARRVEVLVAANAALARGDTQQAAGLYERVVNTPPSNDEGAAAATVVTNFAEFRAMVALLASGEEDQAKEHLDALQSRDANAPLTRLASQIWDQYGMTGQIRSACVQARPQVASQAGPVLTALQAAGVTIDPNSVCGLSSGG